MRTLYFAHSEDAQRYPSIQYPEEICNFPGWSESPEVGDQSARLHGGTLLFRKGSVLVVIDLYHSPGQDPLTVARRIEPFVQGHGEYPKTCPREQWGKL